MSQIVLFYLIYINAVVSDLTVGDVVETVYQIGNSRLTRSGRTDERDLLPRFCMERKILKHHLSSVVTEINVIELDVALDLAVRNGSVAVFMFPSPTSGSVSDLGNASGLVVDNGVDHLNVSVVYLDILVEHVEYTFRAG